MDLCAQLAATQYTLFRVNYSFCKFVAAVTVCHARLAYVSMGLMYYLHTRARFSLDWANVVLVTGRSTLRGVLTLVFMLSVCNLNVIHQSYVTPSVVTMLAYDMRVFLTVRVCCVLYYWVQVVIRVSLDFEEGDFHSVRKKPLFQCVNTNL